MIGRTDFGSLLQLSTRFTLVNCDGESSQCSCVVHATENRAGMRVREGSQQYSRSPKNSMRFGGWPTVPYGGTGENLRIPQNRIRVSLELVDDRSTILEYSRGRLNPTILGWWGTENSSTSVENIKSHFQCTIVVKETETDKNCTVLFLYSHFLRS